MDNTKYPDLLVRHLENEVGNGCNVGVGKDRDRLKSSILIFDATTYLLLYNHYHEYPVPIPTLIAWAREELLFFSIDIAMERPKSTTCCDLLQVSL